MSHQSLTESLQETLSVFDTSGTPLTTSEVADHLDLGRRSTYDRLDRLVEHGRLETKKVGASARVWWRPRSEPPPEHRGSSSEWSAVTESLIDDVLDGADVGVFVLDDEFDVAWINATTERYFGLDHREVVGRDKRELVDGTIADAVEDSASFVETLLAAYEENTDPEQFECHVTAGNGREERWLEHHSEPIESGAFAGGRVELYYDVTDRKQTERARDEDRKQFESLVAAVEEYAIFRLDADGRVRTWNSGAERIKGYDADDVLGEHVSIFYTDEDREAGAPERNLAAAAEDGWTESDGWRVRKDGSRFWANVTVTAIRDDDGELDGYVKVTRDMTERREYEQRLREEKAFVESLFDNQHDIVYAFDADGEFLRWNDRLREVTGYADARISEMGPRDFVVDEATEEMSTAIERVLQGDSITAELALETADGTTVPYEFTATPIRDDGEVVGVTGIGRDVTERRRKKRQLERQRDELESELEDVFGRIDDAFCALDEEWRFTHANERAANYLNQSVGELVGQNVWEVFPEAVNSTFEEQFEYALETKKSVSFEEYYPPLESWFEVTAYPSESGISVYFRDVTERKQRERELEETRRRYETLVEHFPNGAVALVDQDLCYVTFGGEPESIEDVQRADLEEAYLRDALPQELGNVVVPRYEAALDGESARFEETVGDRVYQFQFVPVRDEDGEIFTAMGMSQDVTERKQRERELKQYEQMVETVDDGIYLLDADHEFRMVNSAFVSMTDYSCDELIGSHAELVFGDKYVNIANRKQAEMQERGESVAVLEEELYPATDDPIIVESRFTLFEFADGERGRVGTVRDVTERVERERELEQYETILETVDDGIYAVDDDARMIIVNEGLCDLTGYDREELLGAPATMLHDDEVTPRAESMAAQLAAGERDVASIDLDIHTKSGESVPCESRLAPFPMGDSEGRCGIVRDISDRIERERRLEQQIHQQEIVTDLGQRALEDHDLGALMAEAAELVADTLDNEYSKVLELDADGDGLRLREGVGWEEGIVGSTTISAVDDESQAAHTMQTDQPVVVTDLDAESRFSGPDLLTDHGVRSGVSVVIGPSDDPWGILGTHDTEPREFAEHEVNFVQSVATILASAVARHGHERELVHQREQLAALNHLNEVVREVTDAVLEQSTREQIEQTVCDLLADSDSYMFAWIGDVDVASESVTLKAEAGVEGYLDEITISVDPDDERSRGPTGRALQTGEIQTTQDINADDSHDPWRELIGRYGFRSSAAIPIVHEETVYGVLNVYAERPEAFEGEERAVISQLGEVVGHTIAATERKRALMSDEMVELEFHLRDVFDAVGADADETGTITLDYAVPVEDEEYLVYGSATADAVDDVRTLVEAVPHWESVDFHDESGDTDLRLRLSEPPVLSVVASLGGSVERAVFDDGDFDMTLHVSPSADVRQIIDAVEETYPTAQLLKRRQITRQDDPADHVERALTADLTDRQRTVLEAAYYAGFFDWPRDASGEDVANSLGIAAPTFHQHLRKAEQKVFDRFLASSLS